MKKIKTLGIIAEYNPFHNGHAWQLEQARKLTGCQTIVVIMSGNFVQRGEPAVIDKHKRAEQAVRSGADVVMELPYIYAVQAASGFAQGAVKILKKAGIDALCFGSECGNLENLIDIADTPVNPDHLREAMHTGMSFVRSYSLLTAEMEPNDILAVSYLKELKHTQIQPVLIQRTSGYLDESMSDNASALAIRKAVKNNEDISFATPMADILKQSTPVFPEAYYPYLRTFLLATSAERLREFFLVNEGIENHLKKAAMECDDFESFMNKTVTYRYTSGRIKRTLIHILNQVTLAEAQILKQSDTIRILSFNDTGRKWLAQCRKKEIPVCSRFADMPANERDIAYRTALLYTSVMDKAEKNRILKEEIRGAHYIND